MFKNILSLLTGEPVPKVVELEILFIKMFGENYSQKIVKTRVLKSCKDKYILRSFSLNRFHLKKKNEKIKIPIHCN